VEPVEQPAQEVATSDTTDSDVMYRHGITVTCIICLMEIDTGASVSVYACGHMLHTECMQAALGNVNTRVKISRCCLLCRQKSRPLTQLFRDYSEDPLTEADAGDDTFMVFIKTFDGKTITLDVEGGYTIDNVKAKIQDKEGYESCDFQLIFSGKFLDGGRTVSSYNIESQSMLHVFGGLRGGSPKKRPRAVAATEMRHLENDPPLVTQLLQQPGWSAKEFLGAMTREQAAEFCNQLGAAMQSMR
jgi:hypothetical protein